VEDKLQKEAAAVAGSVLTAFLGLKLIKTNSDYFIRKPIIRCEYL
jgi:hypothetical protein